jgi:hypothetical protein
VIDLYGLARDELDTTQGTFIFLVPVDYPAFCRDGFPGHLLFAAFGPVRALCRIVGSGFPHDFLVAGDRGLVGFHQFDPIGSERPVAVVQEVADLHPFTWLLGVSAFRPSPEHLPLSVPDLIEGLAGADMSVVIRPSPDNRVEFLDHLSGGGLLVRLQIVFDPSQVPQDLVFLGDDERFRPATEFPDVEPEEVEPFIDVNDPGLRFANRQAAISEESFDTGSDVGFQYFSCRGRHHEVVGVADQIDPLVESSAVGRGSEASAWPFAAKQPLHPVQCHVRQQGGYYAPLRGAGVRGRGLAEFDHSCFEPSADRGGEYGQLRQEWSMVDVVEASADVRVENPPTRPFLIEGRPEGLDGIHRTASRPEPVGVGLESGLPFRLQGCLDNGLHHPIFHGRYAQGADLSHAFRDVDPSDGEWPVSLEPQALSEQFQSGLRGDAYHPIDARCVLALVLLRDTPDGQELVGRGSHEELLEVFNLVPSALHAGSVDPLLQSPYIRFHRMPIDVGPRGLRLSLGLFDEWLHRLTSPRVVALLSFRTAKTCRKSAPFRVRYLRSRGPIRPITGRLSLPPTSFTPCPVSLPCGRATTEVGDMGLTQLSIEKNLGGMVGISAPVGLVGCRCPQLNEAVLPTYRFGDGLSASLAISALTEL